MADEDLLQSWKEIAAYLGRSERTCRRWETEFRLPVHRMDGSPRSSVFAFRSELDRWMDEVLHKERRGPPSKKRLASRRSLTFILTLVVIPAIAIAVMVLRDGPSEPQKPSSSTNPTLAVLPFKNNTGDEGLDSWENALADLLVTDLSQSRYLTVLPQDRVFSVLRDLDLLDAGVGDAIVLEEVAARAQVENIVFGNFIKVGQRFRINATVRHIATGDAVVLPSVEARNEEEILPRIDELSAMIKNQLVSSVESTVGDFDVDIGTITTSSLEAYRYFTEGRASYYDGRVIQAMECFEKAVAVDPGFATAYSWLAVCCFSLPGYEDKAEESIARAFELSRHASPRERFDIRGRCYTSRGLGSWDQALETYVEFVRVYPDDYGAAYNLGRLYFRLEKWEKCIETLEGIRNPQEFSSHIVYLSRAHAALGQYDAALEVTKTTAAGVDSFRYRHQLTLTLVFERRFDAALREADEMLKRAPGWAGALMVKGDVHFYRAEWHQAEEYYSELLNPVGPEQHRLRYRLDGSRRLVGLHLAKGQFEQAIDILTQAIDEVTALEERQWPLVLHFHKAWILFAQGDLSGADAEVQNALEEAERENHVRGVMGCLQLRGMIRLELGDVRGAEQNAVELKEEIEGWLSPTLMRRWYRLAGHIDLARNDADRAVERFEKAVSLLAHEHGPNGDGHAVYYSSLAHAYYLSGDIGKAQEWFEKILALTSGRLDFGDIYAKSHFMLGKIYQQRGMNAEAIRSYRSFLDLWRDADAGIPEVEEAKRSLAELLDQVLP